MSRALALGLAVLAGCGLPACISNAPIVPVTPANQAQVSSCTTTADWHNGVVVGDFVVGGTGAALAGVAALESDSTTKNNLAIAGAVAGAVGVAGTAVAAYTAGVFANSNCSSVVGPLAAGSQGATK